LLSPTILGAAVPTSTDNEAITTVPVLAAAASNVVSTSTDTVTSTELHDDDHFPNRSEARVLIVGCGNSSQPFDMIHDGWTGGIVGVDFSSCVVEQMRDKVSKSESISELATKHTKDRNQLLDFVCADVTLPLTGFDPGSFDLIVCKGTLDAILCSQGCRANAISFITNCVQLLSSKHGVLFILSTGNPDSRFEYLEYRNELSWHWRNVSIHLLRNHSTPENNDHNHQPP
jgi:SAM-dependent methyltransferase